VEVRLDLARLGLGAEFEARDARGGEGISRAGDLLSVPLAARSYTYLTLRPGAEPGHG
jgi:hypothetical protein